MSDFRPSRLESRAAGQTEPCFCCGTSVELVMLDVDGTLHTCPQPYLDRWLLGQRRKPVDERWWASMQALEAPFDGLRADSESHEVPAEEAALPVRARSVAVEPTSAEGFIDG